VWEGILTDVNNFKEILVVEDDEVIRSSIIEVLKSEGFVATGVPNGLEALEYLKSCVTKPYLILLDIMMPVMDGWTFRDKQQKDESIKEIPVVVITADGNAKDKAFKMNAQGWVKKPIDIDALLETVARFQ
jgi:two-component system chemotaxis response regulator CheY